jgi:hypothetical protein
MNNSQPKPKFTKAFLSTNPNFTAKIIMEHFGPTFIFLAITKWSTLAMIISQPKPKFTKVQSSQPKL